MEFVSIALLSILGFVTGMYSTIVGGGALLMVPAMIFFGMGPHEAIATNKFSNIGANLAGWSEFHTKKLINYKIGAFTAFFAVSGSIVGSLVLIETDAGSVKKIISVATLILLGVIMLKKDAGIMPQKKALSTPEWIGGAVLSFGIGLYGGFYGGGFATLYSYLLVLLFGQTFLESAGTRKIGGLLILVSSALILGWNNLIAYSVGLPVFAATTVGSHIGAHYSTRIGNKWIKRMFFAAVLLMSLELIL